MKTKIRKLLQIGIIVESVDKAVRNYEMILGSKTTPEETYEFLRNRFPAFVGEK